MLELLLLLNIFRLKNIKNKLRDRVSKILINFFKEKRYFLYNYNNY